MLQKKASLSHRVSRATKILSFALLLFTILRQSDQVSRSKQCRVRVQKRAEREGFSLIRYSQRPKAHPASQTRFLTTLTGTATFSFEILRPHYYDRILRRL